jgi:hypothetical protein
MKYTWVRLLVDIVDVTCVRIHGLECKYTL